MKKFFAVLLAALMVISLLPVVASANNTREIEPNNALNQATQINVNTDVSGNIENSSDVDNYVFTIAEKGTLQLVFSYSSGTAGHRVRLYDSSNTVIDDAYYYRSSDVFPARMTRLRVPAGTYYVRVEHYSNASADYTIRADYTAEPGALFESEPNGAINQANPLTNGQNVTGNIHNSSDVDNYSFTIPGNGTLQLVFGYSSGTAGHRVRLYDSSNAVIDDAYFYRSSDVFPARMTRLRVPAGTYYVRVEHYSNAPGDYTIRYEFTDETGRNFEIEPNNATNIATPINLNTAYTGNIHTSGDADYYSFAGSANQNITLTFNYTQGTPGHRVRIVNSSGNTLLDEYYYRSSDVMPATTREVTLPAAGTYYIWIAHYSNAFNDYTIQVNSGGAPAVTPTPAPTATATPTPTPTATASPTPTPTASAITMSLSKTSFAPNERITVNYSGVTQEMVHSQAWIGIAQTGANARDYLSWSYVAVGSGQVQLTAPNTSGSYEVRFFTAHGAVEINIVRNASLPFTVGAAATPTPSPTPAPSGNDTATFNGRTYQIIDQSMTWYEARAYAESLGGHLVTITSQAEQTFIEGFIANGSKNWYWLGGYSEHLINFQWITGETWGFTKWGPSEPNNYDGRFENCMMIYRTAGTNPAYTWADINSEGADSPTFYNLSNSGFIVERGSIETAPTPTPTPHTGNATHLRGQNNTTHTFYVIGATSGSVWGSDIYTDDSNIARAAVHAGLVSVGQGANVTIRILPGQSSYTGTTRNGVTTSNYGSWGGSYEFVGAEQTPVQTPAPTPPPSSGGNFGNFQSESVNLVGIRLEWNPIAGSVGYRVYRSENQGEIGIPATDFYTEGHDFVDVNIRSNTTYYYTVRQILREATVQGDPEVYGAETAQVRVTSPGTIAGENLVPPYADAQKRTIVMQIDNPNMTMSDGSISEIDPGRGTVPLIRNSRTLVPIRAIIEGMGGSVGWTDATQQISLSYGANNVDMWLERNSIRANGSDINLDVSPTSLNGRTMVPVRGAIENLGGAAEFINSTRQIVVVYY